jgi:FtsZ-interacting cell division protein YlmF
MAFSSDSNLSSHNQDSTDSSGMKVEEKIARAYHRDLSWRKVLVRLEPDAHNNMIVRRMFANAYGWPVIKHLCDTHFAYTHSALTRDEYEAARERAKPMDAPVPETGEEVAEQTELKVAARTQSETREATDELAALKVVKDGTSSSRSSKTLKTLSRESSGMWDDAYFEGSDDDDEVDERHFVARMLNPHAQPVKKPEQAYQRPSSESKSSANGAPRTPTTPYTDGHRGLSPTTSRSPGSTGSGRRGKANIVDDPMIAGRLVEEPEPLPSGSTSGLGLRKSVEEQVAQAPPNPTKAKSASK